MLLMVVFFVGSVLLSLLRGPSHFRKQARMVAEYVGRNGYVLLNPAIVTMKDQSMPSLVNLAMAGEFLRATTGITDIDPFDRGSDRNAFAFVCTLAGKEVTIFTFSHAPPLNTSANASGPQYRVAKIRAAGLPRFSLARHSVVEKIQKLTDYLAETTSTSTSTSLERPEFKDFFKEYWMKGPDAPAVFAFLTPAKLRFLQSAKLSGQLESNAEYLVYYESQARDPRSAAEYDSFIGVVSGLIANLL